MKPPKTHRVFRREVPWEASRARGRTAIGPLRGPIEINLTAGRSTLRRTILYVGHETRAKALNSTPVSTSTVVARPSPPLIKHRQTRDTGHAQPLYQLLRSFALRAAYSSMVRRDMACNNVVMLHDNARAFRKIRRRTGTRSLTRVWYA